MVQSCAWAPNLGFYIIVGLLVLLVGLVAWGYQRLAAWFEILRDQHRRTMR